MSDITKDDVINFIANMTVLDLSELIKELEDKFGVSAAAPVAAFAAMPGDGQAAEVEEQTEFTVILMTSGDKKIQVIKEIRAITHRFRDKKSFITASVESDQKAHSHSTSF